MKLAPVCHICKDGKRLPWSKIWGCVGAGCQRVAFGRRFMVYHCKKHRAPTEPGKPSLCVTCAAAQTSEAK
jgi:hypothetical protein